MLPMIQKHSNTSPTRMTGDVISFEVFNEIKKSLHVLLSYCGFDKKNIIWSKTKHNKGHAVIGHSVGSRLGQVLECFSLETHDVFALARCDIDAALSEIEVLSGFVPVHDEEVELAAASSKAELVGRQN